VKNVSYLGNVYGSSCSPPCRSYCEPVTYGSHAGRGFSRFPRGGSEMSSSSPALARQGCSHQAGVGVHEEGNYRSFRRERFSRAPGGAVESGRTEGWCSSRFSRASPSWPGMKSRKPSISNVLPPSIRKEISSDGCVAGDVVRQRRGLGVEILMGSA
jgi:hypothetical protein